MRRFFSQNPERRNTTVILDHDRCLSVDDPQDNKSKLNLPLAKTMAETFKELIILTYFDITIENIDRIIKTKTDLADQHSCIVKEVYTVQDLFWHIDTDILKEFVEMVYKKKQEQKERSLPDICREILSDKANKQYKQIADIFLCKSAVQAMQKIPIDNLGKAFKEAENLRLPDKVTSLKNKDNLCIQMSTFLEETFLLNKKALVLMLDSRKRKKGDSILFCDDNMSHLMGFSDSSFGAQRCGLNIPVTVVFVNTVKLSEHLNTEAYYLRMIQEHRIRVEILTKIDDLITRLQIEKKPKNDPTALPDEKQPPRFENMVNELQLLKTFLLTPELIVMELLAMQIKEKKISQSQTHTVTDISVKDIIECWKQKVIALDDLSVLSKEDNRLATDIIKFKESFLKKYEDVFLVALPIMKEGEYKASSSSVTVKFNQDSNQYLSETNRF